MTSLGVMVYDGVNRPGARFTKIINMSGFTKNTQWEIIAEKSCTLIFATHVIEYAFEGVCLSMCTFMRGKYLN